MSLQNPNAGEDVNALNGIISTYAAEIAGNSILQKELSRLRECLVHRGEHTRSERLKVFEHILSEIRESSDDHLRMNEESPQLDFHENESNQHLADQETFLQALSGFGVRYLN